jgi:hypothetical protein
VAIYKGTPRKGVCERSSGHDFPRTLRRRKCFRGERPFPSIYDRGTHIRTRARVYIHHTRTQNHCVRSPPTVTRQNHPFDLTCIYSAHIYYIYIYRRQYNRVYCCYVCVCVCVILNNNNTSANTRNLVERLDPLHCVCGGYHRAAHDTIDDYDVYII